MNLSYDDVSELIEITNSHLDSINSRYSVLDETKLVPGSAVKVPTKFNLGINYRFSNDLRLLGEFHYYLRSEFFGKFRPVYLRVLNYLI